MLKLSFLIHVAFFAFISTCSNVTQNINQVFIQKFFGFLQIFIVEYFLTEENYRREIKILKSEQEPDLFDAGKDIA